MHQTRPEARRTKRLVLLPMRVVEEERVESGEGLGRKVLATESTDSREEHLESPGSSIEGQDCGSCL